MGCTQQKQSSPSRKRNDDSTTNGQFDTKLTQNVITIQYFNQKQIRSKINSGRHYNFVLQQVTLQNNILNSTIMVRRKNQENLPSKKEYMTSSNGCN
ncbi:unnamed protein product [Paramecium pentaurelia]|uniref:Uncharacterized protein n=1 Tax=Paramecium pentaurelia TaxID=43138 RepID=A0A8S1TN81_9CILI|nr:unnamed protein product [Paramecium pentaurelia]